MINNYMCDKCDHVLVCKKVDVLDRFNSESKKYINVDIEMLSCKDFAVAEVGGE